MSAADKRGVFMYRAELGTWSLYVQLRALCRSLPWQPSSFCDKDSVMVQASAPYSRTFSTVALKTLSYVCMEQVDF